MLIPIFLMFVLFSYVDHLAFSDKRNIARVVDRHHL